MPDLADTSGTAAAARALKGLARERYFARAAAFEESRASYPAAWREAAGFNQAMIHLTPAELKAVDSFRLRLTSPAAARADADAERKLSSPPRRPEMAQELSSLFSAVDVTAFTGELADYVMLSFRESLAPGIEGWWEDQCAQVSPWGFELASISVPVLVVQGRQDQLVPFGHGQWLAAHVPGAQAWLREDDGHWTPYEYRVPEVHAWLSDRFTNRSSGTRAEVQTRAAQRRGTPWGRAGFSPKFPLISPLHSRLLGRDQVSLALWQHEA